MTTVSKSSPHYQWDPDSPGWLLRKVAEGETISRADVIRVTKANPDMEMDPVLFDLMKGVVSGSLKGRAGRKPDLDTTVRHFMAVSLYHEYLRRIRKRMRREKERRKLEGKRGHKRVRSDMSATELACALVAKQLEYESGDVVRNLVSEAKNRTIRVRYNPDDL